MNTGGKDKIYKDIILTTILLVCNEARLRLLEMQLYAGSTAD